MADRGAIVLRAAMVNMNDDIYQIRNGTGIGVFAPQYGPRRALYGGVKWEFPTLKAGGLDALRPRFFGLIENEACRKLKRK